MCVGPTHASWVAGVLAGRTGAHGRLRFSEMVGAAHRLPCGARCRLRARKLGRWPQTSEPGPAGIRQPLRASASRQALGAHGPRWGVGGFRPGAEVRFVAANGRSRLVAVIRRSSSGRQLPTRCSHSSRLCERPLGSCRWQGSKESSSSV